MIITSFLFAVALQSQAQELRDPYTDAPPGSEAALEVTPTQMPKDTMGVGATTSIGATGMGSTTTNGGAPVGGADAMTGASENSVEALIGPRLSSRDYSQLFVVQAGPIHPRSIAPSNGDYRYQFGDNSLSSTSIQAGWALRLFNLGGAFHFEETLGFTELSGMVETNSHGEDSTDKLNVYMGTLDSRIMYSAEWFPWKILVPFVDGGYAYSLYDQTGRSDLESAQGISGNWVAGAGFRLWLNRGSINGSSFSARMTTIPIYLSFKMNWVQANNQDVDLGGRSYLAGLAVGL